jgi:hypothetical protein
VIGPREEDEADPAVAYRIISAVSLRTVAYRCVSWRIVQDSAVCRSSSNSTSIWLSSVAKAGRYLSREGREKKNVGGRGIVAPMEKGSQGCSGC